MKKSTFNIDWNFMITKTVKRGFLCELKDIPPSKLSKYHKNCIIETYLVYASPI